MSAAELVERARRVAPELERHGRWYRQHGQASRCRAEVALAELLADAAALLCAFCECAGDVRPGARARGEGGQAG